MELMQSIWEVVETALLGLDVPYGQCMIRQAERFARYSWSISWISNPPELHADDTRCCAATGCK
jgi:hypothetical protein